MASINFPANPTVGQEYPFGDFIYVWDGVKWTTKVIVGSTEEGDAKYVNITGDTMTGPLNIQANHGALTIRSDVNQPSYVLSLVNDANSWYVGKASTTGNDIALHSYAHSTNLVLKSDHISFNKDPRTEALQGTNVNSLTRKDYVDGTFLKLNDARASHAYSYQADGPTPESSGATYISGGLNPGLFIEVANKTAWGIYDEPNSVELRFTAYDRSTGAYLGPKLFIRNTAGVFGTYITSPYSLSVQGTEITSLTRKDYVDGVVLVERNRISELESVISALTARIEALEAQIASTLVM